MEKRKIWEVKKIWGRADLKIKIISRCPDCGHIWGIVGNDDEPILYNPMYVEIKREKIDLIPLQKCKRCLRKNKIGASLQFAPMSA